jgi:hypothetical protein
MDFAKIIIKEATNYIARFKIYSTTMIWRRRNERGVVMDWKRRWFEGNEMKERIKTFLLIVATINKKGFLI